MADISKNSDESEPVGKIGSGVPTLLSEIGTRISEISRCYGKKGFAAKAHISESHLYRYLSGKSDPTATRIVAMAEAAGVRPGWLLTGEPPMRPRGGGSVGEQAPREPTGGPSEQDLELLEEVAAAAFSELQARDIRLVPAAQARLVRVLYRHFATKRERPDHDTISNIIDLAAYR